MTGALAQRAMQKRETENNGKEFVLDHAARPSMSKDYHVGNQDVDMFNGEANGFGD